MRHCYHGVSPRGDNALYLSKDRKRMVYDIMGMTIPYVISVSQTKYWRGCINFNTLPYLLSCLLTDTIRQSSHSISFQLTRPAQPTDARLSYTPRTARMLDQVVTIRYSGNTK